jgi:hypothetical protein
MGCCLGSTGHLPVPGEIPFHDSVREHGGTPRVGAVAAAVGEMEKERVRVARSARVGLYRAPDHKFIGELADQQI